MKYRSSMSDTKNYANYYEDGIVELSESGSIVRFVSDSGTDETHRLERQYGAASVKIDFNSPVENKEGR